MPQEIPRIIIPAPSGRIVIISPTHLIKRLIRLLLLGEMGLLEGGGCAGQIEHRGLVG